MTLSTIFFQSNLNQWLWALGCLCLLLVFYMKIWKFIPKRAHFPVVTFGFLYTLICLLGGILVGISEADWLLQLQPQGGYRVLTPETISWPLYWCLLFTPMFLFPLGVLAGEITFPGEPVERKPVHFPWGLPIFIFLFLVFVITFRNYSARLFVDWVSNGGDFSQMIRNRGMVLSSLNYFSLNIFYVLAPLFVCALSFQFFKKRRWIDIVLVFGALTLVLGFTILTYQKLLFFMTLLVSGSYLLYRRVLPTQLFVLGCFLAPGLLMLISLVSNNPFRFIEVFSHFILRTGSVVSYYVAYASQSFYFPGYDMPLDGRTIQDNVDVFRYMFPNSSWMGGTSSAPFQLRAYYQGGFLFVAMECVLVGLLVAGVQRLASFYSEGKAFFDALLLVFFFYLCQTSLKDCLVSSYGILFSLFFLTFILDINRRFYGNQK